jgi:2-polyprenyl-6-methoxyphenol hydroxylase-like FAD-dependent oxidoreductase
MDTQVLIAGAGPVGLTLAIDLGRRGIRCTLIEKNEAPLGYPKMERCNPRTMEIFRRLGLAQRIRDAGYPPDWPMDNYLVFSLAKPMLMKFPFLTVAQARERTAATNDGSLPAEPYQVISQYTLEPLLKSVAESIPNVTVRFGCAFESFAQDAGGVRSVVQPANGPSEIITSDYLVGCDGGASEVRKQLGFRLEGETLQTLGQALFRCDELWERVPAPKGRHYHMVDDKWTMMIVQDSTRHFTIHSLDEDMPRRFEKIVGTPVKYETLHINKWTQRLMLSTGYGTGRVFIAGDACHLVIPTGGLGYNTGVGDAIDLSWKLAATLQGWGGPELLKSYEAERRQVGGRNVAGSERGNTGRKVWRDTWRPWIEDDTPEGRAALKHLLAVASVEAGKAASVLGCELGYRYDDSPVISYDTPGEPPPHDVEVYRPTTWPGARLPHVWLEPGVSVNDRIPDGYTLLRLGKRDDASSLQRAFARSGAPFHVLDIDSAAARAVYGFDYLLVRPDLHVVWRGNRLPERAEALARRVTGHGAEATVVREDSLAVSRG